MGLNYQRRGRLQELNVNDPLVWNALGNDIQENGFSKAASYDEIARVENRQLDKADQRLRELFD